MDGRIPKDESSNYKTFGSRVKTNFGFRAGNLINLKISLFENRTLNQGTVTEKL